MPRLHCKRRKLIKTFLINRYGYKKLKENKKYCPCYYCGKEIDKKNATIDHKIPIIAGGSNEIDNFVLCCQKCNLTKDKKILDYQADEMMYGFNCFSKFNT